MDVVKMLEDLHLEVQRVDEAIAAIEALIRGGGKRRGRPRKSLSHPSNQRGLLSNSSNRS
jgi:hypothetical protein